MPFINYGRQPTLPLELSHGPRFTTKMSKNKFACITQGEHCTFLFTETCKLILKMNCFPYIFEIGYFLWQCALAGPEATPALDLTLPQISWALHDLQKFI